jgi:hypothetical protein
MSIEDKVKVLDLLTDSFSRLKKISEDNAFISSYAKDQVINLINDVYDVRELLEYVNIYSLERKSLKTCPSDIACTVLEYSSGVDIDSYVSSKCHSSIFFDDTLKQFMVHINGRVLKGCIGKLSSKRSKKNMRCYSGPGCKSSGCPYYHIHDIEFVRGRHPSEILDSDQDYIDRRMVHDLLMSQVSGSYKNLNSKQKNK